MNGTTREYLVKVSCWTEDAAEANEDIDLFIAEVDGKPLLSALSDSIRRNNGPELERITLNFTAVGALETP